MTDKQFDVCSLAQANIDGALDFPAKVIAATIPMAVEEFQSTIKDKKSIQVVATDAGIFIIAWKQNGTFDILSLVRTHVPQPL